jgi:N-acyl-D-amino-acid deacylase
MKSRLVHRFVLSALLYAFPGFLFDAFAEDLVPGNEAIKAAVAKSLPLLETGARGSMEKRKQCFTCHNQALPIMALTTARSRGITIDAENLRRQVQFTADFLGKNRTNYLAGQGQGGQALTAGYALWTLAIGGWKSDETTDAVAEYLLKFQNDLDHWKPQTVRPPVKEVCLLSAMSPCAA